MLKLALAGAMALALSLPAAAQTPCFTPADAKPIMESRGYRYIGVEPYGDGTAVFYEVDGVGVYAAPIDEKGCVRPVGEMVPDYVLSVAA